MSSLLSALSPQPFSRKHSKALLRSAKADLLDIGEVLTVAPSPSDLDGNESLRFGELVRYEVLDECFNDPHNTGEAFASDEYDVFLSGQYAMVKQQLLIVEEANGKIAQVDDLYVRTDYTQRITVLKERLAFLAKDLMPFIDRAMRASA